MLKWNVRSKKNTPGLCVFFFGRTFDLVSERQRISACTEPHPLCTYVENKSWSSKTTARKTVELFFRWF